MRRCIPLTTLFLSLSLAVGCENKSDVAVNSGNQSSPRTMPSNHPAITDAVGASKVVSGTVVETMDVTQYTYLLLENPNGKVWAAVPKSKVRVGQSVSVIKAMPMKNFESPSLKREFDEIYFGVLKGAAGTTHSASLARGSTTSAPGMATIKVDKATGANAQTVAKVFAQSAHLKGKTVRIRGVIVKVNRNILGKDWVHLRDGSGSDAEKNHDLVVTCESSPEVGTTVLMEGKVATDRDFGAGYKYEVLVEEATFKTEI